MIETFVGIGVTVQTGTPVGCFFYPTTHHDGLKQSLPFETKEGGYRLIAHLLGKGEITPLIAELFQRQLAQNKTLPQNEEERSTITNHFSLIPTGDTDKDPDRAQAAMMKVRDALLGSWPPTTSNN